MINNHLKRKLIIITERDILSALKTFYIPFIPKTTAMTFSHVLDFSNTLTV